MSKVDPLLAFADLLRSKTGVEARSAILEQERVEFIRGKDLQRWILANQDQVNLAIAKGKTPDEQVQEIGSLLLRRNFLVQCDRMFKKPPPGQERLVKFPKKLVKITGADAMTFSTGSFYAWTYEKPTSPWVYAMSILAALGVILVCLLPIAPNWVKIGVLYLSATLLTVLLTLVFIRSIVAAATWILTGNTVWILPNLMADDKPVSELFSPMISVSKLTDDDSKWGNHILVRGAVAVMLAGVGWVLYSHAPQSSSVKNNLGHYRDELFEMLHIERPGLTAGNNATGDSGSGSGSNGGGEGVPGGMNSGGEQVHMGGEDVGDAAHDAGEL